MRTLQKAGLLRREGPDFGGRWNINGLKEPKKDVAILLDRLGLTLPAQPPPKISGSLADTAKTKV